MKIKYFGHMAVLIETQGKKLLFDPLITDNPLIAGKVKPDQIKADYILLTHAHFDHLGDTEKIARQNNSLIISSAEIVGYFQKKGIQGHPLNCGGKWKFEFGTVKMVNAIHSSSFPDGTYGGPASGFILFIENKVVYFAGDTAVTKDMEIWGSMYNIYLSFLPVGDNFTMDVEEALLAAKFLKTKKVIPVHYNTWPLIQVNISEIKQKFVQNGFDCIVMEPLSEIEL